MQMYWCAVSLATFGWFHICRCTACQRTGTTSFHSCLATECWMERIPLSLYGTRRIHFQVLYSFFSFLVMPGPDVNRIIPFVNIKPHPSWTMKGTAAALGIPFLTFPCRLLRALERIAWPSLSMQWVITALHDAHIVRLCYQQFEWQDALMSAFSLCFALAFPLLCSSLPHTPFPWSWSLFLAYASHIIFVFSFDAEHFSIFSH